MVRQEKGGHEVSVEELSICNDRARQERDSHGCDGCLCYHSRRERLLLPVNHPRLVLQRSPRLSGETCDGEITNEHSPHQIRIADLLKRNAEPSSPILSLAYV